MLATKLIIFYSSFLYFPILFYVAWRVVKKGISSNALQLLIMLPLTVFAYARFVEPRILNVVHASFDIPVSQIEDTLDVKFLVFSDMHYGIFRNAKPLDQIIAKANRLEYDAVLIPGDLVYHLEADDIKQTFSILADLKRPVFVVMGNHDVGRPGPDLGLRLMAYLSGIENVTVLNNRVGILEIDDQTIEIFGTSDLWQRRHLFQSSVARSKSPRLILTHNPDMALQVPNGFPYDLMVAGHTHGGQIRLPFVYKSQIPTQYPFDKGLHQVQTKQGVKPVFVTPGTGMIGLPMRFLMPPQLDLISIKFTAADTIPSENVR